MIGELDGHPILASETCALDIIGAQYVRDVENGEVVVFDEQGVHSHKPFPPMRRGRASSNTSISRGRIRSSAAARVYDVRKTMGAELAREAPAAADVVVPVPDSGVPAAIGYAQAVRHPLRARHHPQSLCRPHLHRADPADPPARRAAQAQRQPRGGQRQAHRAGRQLDRARHHLDQDRADDARRRRDRSAFPHRLAADHASGLLRHRHAGARQAARRDPRPRRACAAFIGADSLAFLSVAGIYRAMGHDERDPVRPQFTDHCFTGDYPTPLTDQTARKHAPRQLSLLAEAS